MHWNKLTLVGVGLLGGSIGLAAKQRRLADHVAGYVRRAESLAECERAGAVDQATLDLRQAVEGADLVILCTPIAQMRRLTEQLLPVLKRGALVTDVGSVKGCVVRDLEALVASAGAHFIGSHPMAGAEKMGVASARAELFEKAVCVVTPAAASPPELTAKLEQLWASLGGLPLRMTAELHDELVSRSSHLPYVLAATLVDVVLDASLPPQQPLLCATGFRDTTRIASGSPEMWRDIAVANRENLSCALAGYVERLQQLRQLLDAADATALEKFFAEAKQLRDAWCARMTSVSSE